MHIRRLQLCISSRLPTTIADLLHGLNLSSRADPTDRETNVDGRPNSLVEELSLEEDLSVSDRDDVGGDIGGHIASLRLNHRQGSEGPTPIIVIHLGGPLQETRVEIEDIARVGLTTRGTAQQQRHLTIGNGLSTERIQ